MSTFTPPVNKQHDGNQDINNRLAYIDSLKGFAILCIIMHHTYTCNSVFDGNHQNALFFFLSGVFFKSKKGNKTRYVKLLKRILIPFVCFYMLSYFWQMIAYYWDFRSLDKFHWEMLFDIFCISERQGYLRVNVPLWFLLTLAIIQGLYHFIPNNFSNTKVFASLCIICLFNVIMGFPTPFMLNKVIYWSSFFMLGNVLGKHIIKCSTVESNRILVCLLVWLLMLLCEYNTDIVNFHLVLKQFEILAFCIFSIVLFSRIYRESQMFRMLKYYGKNSLLIVCTHMILVHIGMRLLNKINIIEIDVVQGLLCTTMVALCLIPVIELTNKYMPILAGK